MIAVDTNVLARVYRDDPDDPESKRQRPLARQGLDLADALHLTRRAARERFVSFNDRSFVRRARRLGLVPEVVMLR